MIQITKWFLDGHPQKYHVAALFLAVTALSMVFTTTLLAQTSDSDTIISTTPTVTTACSYSYSDWTACQSTGKRSRNVTDMSPSGCVQVSAPMIQESCNYTPPQCSYSYGEWGECQSSGTQSRPLLSKTPSGCLQTTNPALSRSCTYTAPTTNNNTANNTTATSNPTPSLVMSTACSYNYSDWTACQSNGKRSRGVTGVSPSGCVETTAPKTTESCTYTSTTTATTTPEQCVYTYSNWGVCQTNSKRFRTLLSKLPGSCKEYTHPVLEQSCVYDTAASTAVSPLVVPTSTSPSASSLAATTGTSDIDEAVTIVTPAFSFVNVSDGAVIHGTFEIKGVVQGAQEVGYYLVQSGSNTFKYIGSGTRVSDNGWNLKFRSAEFPNGEFYLRAKIKNQYGEYGSGQRKISIANTERLALGTTGSEDGFVPLEMKNEEKAQIFQNIVTEWQLPIITETNTIDGESVNQQKKRILSYCEEYPEQCRPEKDTDEDGLSDIDEIRYGSNPNEADTDLDGFVDGDEVKNGFNPVKYSPGDQSDRIVFEDPKTSGEVKKKNYVVETVELRSDDAGKKKLHLSGKGLPNSFVTIYVYSNPIVLTVKTDSEGNWTYELDKELEDGEHEAYVAITDNTGKITGKSEPIAFVKSAQAVTVIPAAQAAPEVILPVTQHRTERDLFFLVAIIIGALAVALATIGLVRHRYAVPGKESL